MLALCEANVAQIDDADGLTLDRASAIDHACSSADLSGVANVRAVAPRKLSSEKIVPSWSGRAPLQPLTPHDVPDYRNVAACHRPASKHRVRAALRFRSEIERLHGQLTATAFWLVPMALGMTAVSLIPAGFYQCRPFERGGRIYERLGVHYFRFLVPHGDGINWLVRRSQPGYRVVRDRQTMAGYEARTIAAEAFQLGCLIVMTPAAAAR